MFHLYGLLIGIGVLVGLFVITKQARRWKVSQTVVEDSLQWIVVSSIFGARLYHVITDWNLYAEDPFPAVFELWNGGLGFFGALFGGMIGVLCYIKLKYKDNHINHFFLILDLLSFGAPLAQAVGRIGNYVNGELYGLPTQLPWAITVQGGKYHPLFAYEAFCTLLLFGLLNWLGWKKKLLLGKGQYACLYLTGYALIRFWLEFLRSDTARWTNDFGVFSIAQWVCIGITVTAILIFWLRRHAPKTTWELRTLL